MERRVRSREELIRELLERLPGWADGFYVRHVAWFDGEEGEESADVYPVKRSRFSAGWYYGRGWRRLASGYEYLSIGRGVVVTRDGRVVEVEERGGRGSRYVTLVPREG